MNRIEFVLNAISSEHAPSEMTKYTWLFGRLKRCRSMSRHIDKIKDSKESSRYRTWGWLFRKLKEHLDELREDANEQVIKDSLSSPLKTGKNQPKANQDHGVNQIAPAAVASATQKDTAPVARRVKRASQRLAKGVLKANPRAKATKPKARTRMKQRESRIQRVLGVQRTLQAARGQRLHACSTQRVLATEGIIVHSHTKVQPHRPRQRRRLLPPKPHRPVVVNRVPLQR